MQVIGHWRIYFWSFYVTFLAYEEVCLLTLRQQSCKWAQLLCVGLSHNYRQKLGWIVFNHKKWSWYAQNTQDSYILAQHSRWQQRHSWETFLEIYAEWANKDWAVLWGQIVAAISTWEAGQASDHEEGTLKVHSHES